MLISTAAFTHCVVVVVLRQTQHAAQIELDWCGMLRCVALVAIVPF